MGVASGCGEQEVGVASGSRWNLWVWLLVVVLRRYIDFLILLLLYLYFFVHLKKCFYNCIFNSISSQIIKQIYISDSSDSYVSIIFSQDKNNLENTFIHRLC